MWTTPSQTGFEFSWTHYTRFLSVAIPWGWGEMFCLYRLANHVFLFILKSKLIFWSNGGMVLWPHKYATVCYLCLTVTCFPPVLFPSRSASHQTSRHSSHPALYYTTHSVTHHTSPWMNDAPRSRHSGTPTTYHPLLGGNESATDVNSIPNYTWHVEVRIFVWHSPGDATEHVAIYIIHSSRL